MSWMSWVEDFTAENIGWIGLAFIVLFLCGIFVAFRIDYQDNLKYEMALVRMGYEVGDVDAFVSVTDFSRKDLVLSQAARKQFERFLRGEEMTIKKTKNSTTVVPIIIPSGR